MGAIITALGSIASLLGKAITFFSAMVTRKDQIELGQARQADVDRAAGDAARARMQTADAKPTDTAKELDDGTF